MDLTTTKLIYFKKPFFKKSVKKPLELGDSFHFLLSVIFTKLVVRTWIMEKKQNYQYTSNKTFRNSVEKPSEPADLFDFFL